jgi:hypothetical protein
MQTAINSTASSGASQFERLSSMQPFYPPARSNVCPQAGQLSTASPSSIPGSPAALWKPLTRTVAIFVVQEWRPATAAGVNSALKPT